MKEKKKIETSNKSLLGKLDEAGKKNEKLEEKIKLINEECIGKEKEVEGKY